MTSYNNLTASKYQVETAISNFCMKNYASYYIKPNPTFDIDTISEKSIITIKQAHTKAAKVIVVYRKDGNCSLAFMSGSNKALAKQACRFIFNSLIVLANAEGVYMLESNKFENKHYKANNAKCICNHELIVAPDALEPNHERGNPVMVCLNNFEHSYFFSELIIGKQEKLGLPVDEA